MYLKAKQDNIVKIFYYKCKDHENICQGISNPLDECDRGDKLFSMNGKKRMHRFAAGIFFSNCSRQIKKHSLYEIRTAAFFNNKKV